MNNFKLCINFLMVITLLISCNHDEVKNETDSYVLHNVEAPFEMPQLKEYVYPQEDFVITDFGASTEIDNTIAISNAIEACSKKGGGRVIIPDGIYSTGPIHLKDNVNLYLEQDAVLSFVDNPEKYLPAVMSSWEGMECMNYSPLIYAYGCKNIAITGTGTIQPKMDVWTTWFERNESHLQALKGLYDMMSTGVPVERRNMAKGENHLRPHLIQFNRCENILLDGFKIRNSPFWTIHMLLCNNGIVRNLDVKAHGQNNDGIDIEMSSNFLVEQCIFDQGDDAIVIKAARNHDGWRLNKPSENIVIRNCEILKGNTLLGIGSELSAGVRNVYLHDCITPKYVYRLFQIKTNHRRGGFVKKIFVENIEVETVKLPLFEIDPDVFYQWKDLVETYEVKLTSISDINLKNINCKEAAMVYYINGDSGNPIGTINLENIHVEKVKDKFKEVKNTTEINENNVFVGNEEDFDN